MLRFSFFWASLALVPFGCTGKDESSDKDSEADADADTDTDADTDADTDTDTAVDTDPTDMDDYQEFARVQAGALCRLWEACGFLDENEYADIDACVKDQLSLLLGATCPEYDPAKARTCIAAEEEVAAECGDYAGGLLPPCVQVCQAPPEDDTGTPPAGPTARRKTK